MPEKIFIRGIPDELWRAIKARASMDGTTVSEAVQNAIRAYLTGSNEKKESSEKDKWEGLIGLGSSGNSDVSTKHDEYLANAIMEKDS